MENLNPRMAGRSELHESLSRFVSLIDPTDPLVRDVRHLQRKLAEDEAADPAVNDD